MLNKKFKLPISLFPTSARTIVKDEVFTVKSVSNNLGLNRVGVTFRSKSFKTAVLRNRFKRIVFDSFRSRGVASGPEATPLGVNGRDLLIVLNPSIINLTKPQIVAAFETLIKKIQS